MPRPARAPDPDAARPRPKATVGIPARPQSDAVEPILDALARHARDRADHPAILAAGSCGRPPEATSYAALAERARRAAHHLDRLSPCEGPVVLCAPNGADYAAVFLGAMLAGREVFPVPTSAGRGEITRAAQTCEAGLIIASDPAADSGAGRARSVRSAELFLAAPASRVADPSPCCAGVLLQSSGTTGLPKVVRRSRRSLDRVAAAIVEAVSLRPEDRVLAAVPMSHSYGMENGLLAPILAGATIVAIQSLDAATLDAALRQHVTVLPGVPFMFEALAARPPVEPRRPRLVYSAGAALPPAVSANFERSWSLRIGQIYGATELGSITFEDPASPTFDRASVGSPLRGVSIRIVDPDRPADSLAAGREGHVLAQAPSMLDSYLDVPAPLVDGHLPTGDLGTLDAAGRLTITGRLKLMIDIGGAKVNPLEVEHVLAEFPGVAECVVVPLRMTDAVSRLRAIVVPSPGQPAPSESSLRAFARDRLAQYKVPRTFEFRTALPKSPTGKVLRGAIEDRP